MYAATAARYCRSTRPNEGGVTLSVPGCSYRTTPTAPATPLDVLSGAIIAPRAVAAGLSPGWVSGSARMLSVRSGSPVRTTLPVVLVVSPISNPCISAHSPTVAAIRSVSPSRCRNATNAPCASTRLTTLCNVYLSSRSRSGAASSQRDSSTRKVPSRRSRSSPTRRATMTARWVAISSAERNTSAGKPSGMPRNVARTCRPSAS